MTRINSTPDLQWNGKTIYTYGDWAEAIDGCKTEEEAQEFLVAATKSVGEFTATHNIGYLIGYFEPKERRSELYSMFNVSHPVTGGKV